MRVLADHCVPTNLITALQDVGVEVQRARDVGLERASDDALFAYARRSGRILVTVDHDFSNIARFDIPRSPGVVLIELADRSKSFLRTRVHGFFRALQPRHVQGRLALLKPTEVVFWPKR